MFFFRKSANLLFSEDKEFVRAMRELIGHTPVQIGHYRMAFKHKSINNDSRENNERLEYLGDSVLSTIVSEYLFMKYPFSDEGFLTQMRSKLVNRKQLNHVGEKLQLDRHLVFKQEGVRQNKSLYGNTFEALVGAIYLDLGFDAAADFIRNRILKDLLDIEEIENTDYDFKSKLHQWAQKEGLSMSFKLEKEERIQGKNFFNIALKIGDKQFQASGFSKKSAEQDACKLACEMLKL